MIPGKENFRGKYWIIFPRKIIMVGEMELDGSKEGFFAHYRLDELQLGVWGLL